MMIILINNENSDIYYYVEFNYMQFSRVHVEFQIDFPLWNI